MLYYINIEKSLEKEKINKQSKNMLYVLREDSFNIFSRFFLFSYVYNILDKLQKRKSLYRRKGNILFCICIFLYC